MITLFWSWGGVRAGMEQHSRGGVAASRAQLPGAGRDRPNNEPAAPVSGPRCLVLDPEAVANPVGEERWPIHGTAPARRGQSHNPLRDREGVSAICDRYADQGAPLRWRTVVGVVFYMFRFRA